MQLPYENRTTAAEVLADQLHAYAGRRNLLVLGLPRGGVPVAYEVARALDGALDLMLVRKLGVPDREELAMGAIASGGIRVLNPEVAQSMSESAIEEVAERELRELRRREEAYRGDRPPPEIGGRCVILVDDGLATGATMRAAVAAVRQQGPGEVIVAVPVAPPDTVEKLRREADAVVCPATPENFMGIGRWYEDFSQTSDETVRELLQRAWSGQA